MKPFFEDDELKAMLTKVRDNLANARDRTCAVDPDGPCIASLEFAATVKDHNAREAMVALARELRSERNRMRESYIELGVVIEQLKLAIEQVTK